jgi:hypothetical protein
MLGMGIGGVRTTQRLEGGSLEEEGEEPKEEKRTRVG